VFCSKTLATLTTGRLGEIQPGFSLVYVATSVRLADLERIQATVATLLAQMSVASLESAILATRQHEHRSAKVVRATTASAPEMAFVRAHSNLVQIVFR
jgi:hypothetical protein